MGQITFLLFKSHDPCTEYTDQKDCARTCKSKVNSLSVSAVFQAIFPTDMNIFGENMFEFLSISAHIQFQSNRISDPYYILAECQGVFW